MLNVGMGQHRTDDGLRMALVGWLILWIKLLGKKINGLELPMSLSRCWGLFVLVVSGDKRPRLEREIVGLAYELPRLKILVQTHGYPSHWCVQLATVSLLTAASIVSCAACCRVHRNALYSLVLGYCPGAV